MFSLPLAHVVAGIAVRQAGLAENGVLKANLRVVLGAWLKQAGDDTA